MLQNTRFGNPAQHVVSTREQQERLFTAMKVKNTA